MFYSHQIIAPRGVTLAQPFCFGQGSEQYKKGSALNIVPGFS
ncbi:hypothetical protein N879_19435 [Alcaligenes sp. EGD-AK7]|nr:hypothetical protein N879_19435 [Alcaligenes sp. EGD-AK7]